MGKANYTFYLCCELTNFFKLILDQSTKCLHLMLNMVYVLNNAKTFLEKQLRFDTTLSYICKQSIQKKQKQLVRFVNLLYLLKF